LHNCAVQHIDVRETGLLAGSSERTLRVTPAIRKGHPELHIEPHTRYLVRLDTGLSLEEKFAAMTLELGHLFCGHLGIDAEAWWSDRKSLELERIDVEAASVAHLVCRRLGLEKAGGQFLSDCLATDRVLPSISLNAIFQAVAYIESMERSFWTKPRKRGRY
jgi:hypothetical protein